MHMELSALQIFSLFGSVIIGFLCAYFLFVKRMSSMSANNISLSRRISELEGEISNLKKFQDAEIDRLRASLLIERNTAEVEAFRNGERQARVQMEEQKQSFSIEVRPFVSKILDEGLFRTTATVQIGYQYQMFVHGIPCFEPHFVIEEDYETKKVDEEKIERLTKKAIGFAEAAVSAKSGAAKALISLIKTPILSGK